MPDVRSAILNAVAEADRLHDEFGTRELTERGYGRVDVFGMLVEHEIPLVFRPLEGLLGAFINDPLPGVIVTTRRQLAVQRFTAAHELGHALLNHDPSLDDPSILRRSPFVARPTYNLQEIQADAFASELLTPQWLLVAHMMRQRWQAHDLSRPDVVYQLSLRLGVSYAATCHALRRYKSVSNAQCQNLLSIQPRTIKRGLVHGYQPPSWHGDVWTITDRDEGMLVEGSAQDIVVICLDEHSGSGYVWNFADLVAAGLSVVADNREAIGNDDCVGGLVSRSVTAQSTGPARGKVRLTEVRPWVPQEEPLSALLFDVDLFGPVGSGILARERKQLLGVA